MSPPVLVSGDKNVKVRLLPKTRGMEKTNVTVLSLPDAKETGKAFGMYIKPCTEIFQSEYMVVPAS